MKDKDKKKQVKEGKEHKKNWQEVWATTAEIEHFLSGHVILRHNVVTNRTEGHVIVKDPEPPDAETADAATYLEWLSEWQAAQQQVAPDAPGYYQPVTDRLVNSLWRGMQMLTGKQVRIQDLQRIIASDYVPEYHPFRQYLERLPTWRKEQGDFILELSLSVNVRGDSDEQLLFYEYLRKWLVAMVASWVNPEVVNNVMLVLIGEQGSYKTTWFSYLLPPVLRQYFYTKTNSGLVSRDDLLTLAQYGLVCWEELDTMRPSELNKLKAAMTMTSIDEREAYARYKEHRQHIASFCGTGNNVQFLSDTTGNRRWLPFEVCNIESPRSSPFNYEGIYSQAYALYRQGFRYWFDASEVRRLSQHNEQFETPQTERELVDLFFRKPMKHESGEFMPVGLAVQIVGGNSAGSLSKEKMGRAFMDLGFDYRRTSSARGYIVVKRSDEERNLYRIQLASGRDASVTDDSMTAHF